MKDAGYSEKWVVYSTDYYSAKELTVLPEAFGHDHAMPPRTA